MAVAASGGEIPGVDNDYVAPGVFESPQIPATITNSSDQNLSAVNGYISSISSINSLTSCLSQISGKSTYVVDDDVMALKASITWKQWTGTSGSTTYWLLYRSDALRYFYRYYVQTSSTAKNKVIEVAELKTKLGGTIKIYNAGAVALNYVWVKDASSGNLSVTMTGTYGTFNFTALITCNADKSGSVKVYLGATTGTALYDVTWKADGHGTYVKDGRSVTF